MVLNKSINLLWESKDKLFESDGINAIHLLYQIIKSKRDFLIIGKASQYRVSMEMKTLPHSIEVDKLLLCGPNLVFDFGYVFLAFLDFNGIHAFYCG